MANTDPPIPPSRAAGAATAALPDSVVTSRKGFSLVWLVPLVAALIGAWLAYKTLSEQGPVITLTFKEGTGLEAGKTKVKYKALEVGLVEAVRFSDDLSHVIVTAKLNKDVENHLGENTKFWMVSPRVGISGVSGLETLVSGVYIEVEFGPGKPTRQFAGLERPPLVKADTPGRRFHLLAEKLGSLQHGSPIYFRDIQVGEVLTTELAEDRQGVKVNIFVNAPYHLLIRDNSRFWKTSGLDVSLGAQGIDVKMESLLTFLAGGIAFDTPSDGPGQPSADDTPFRLFNSFASLTEAAFTQKIPYLMYFDSSVRGLNVGAPVEIRGIKIGTVTDVRLGMNLTTKELRILVMVDLEPERVQPVGAPPPTEQNPAQPNRRPTMEKLVEQGLRAQLKTGSLLTGQLFVDLDFYPNAPPKTIVYGGQHPELPTVPSTLDAFQKTATDILADLQKLPLDKIVNELVGTLQGANRLMNGPELKEALRALETTLKSVQALTQTTDKQLLTLVAGTGKTLESARAVLQGVEPNSTAMTDLARTLEELAAAARSIRELSDYLARHPEALLYGKGGGANR